MLNNDQMTAGIAKRLLKLDTVKKAYCLFVRLCQAIKCLPSYQNNVNQFQNLAA